MVQTLLTLSIWIQSVAVSLPRVGEQLLTQSSWSVLVSTTHYSCSGFSQTEVIGFCLLKYA